MAATYPRRYPNRRRYVGVVVARSDTGAGVRGDSVMDAPRIMAGDFHGLQYRVSTLRLHNTRRRITLDDSVVVAGRRGDGSDTNRLANGTTWSGGELSGQFQSRLQAFLSEKQLRSNQIGIGCAAWIVCHLT